MFYREQYQILTSRLKEPRHFIQVVMGPRQVGKTTTVKQVVKDLQTIPYLFFSADNVPGTQPSWISDCWQTARSQMRIDRLTELVLVIDEIQKLKGWSEVVKKEWDEDSFNDLNLKVVLLGSSRVMLQKGLADSLAGRFETIKMTHWSYREMKEAFGYSLEQYIYYGGYPGAAVLMEDEDRWSEYIKNAIIDATINKDILLDTAIGKPALLRQTFELSAAYSGQLLSLTKMVGQLQDAGNTTTLTGYLNLLADSGLVCGLQKFSMDMSRRRASVPKYQVYNNALYNVYSDESLHEAVTTPQVWGRVVESAVGAYLVSHSFVHGYEVFYWRENNDEVDFILKKNTRIVAIEVKSGNDTSNTGLAKFRELYHPHMAFIVGRNGIDLEKFFQIDIKSLFS